MRYVLICILSCLFSSIGFAQVDDLREGQSWSFENAPHPDTRLVIGKIEPFRGGEGVAVGVSVVRLHSEPGLMLGGSIGHMPFSLKSLRPHLLELDKEPLPLDEVFISGYQAWKVAVQQEGAGVFTIPPAEAIEFVFTTVGEGQ